MIAMPPEKNVAKDQIMQTEYKFLFSPYIPQHHYELTGTPLHLTIIRYN
jgi:hypothetical protein